MADFDLDAALINVEDVHDQQTIRDFAAFLEDRTSRCAICLTDDNEDASWRDHPKLGRFFVCRHCIASGIEVNSR